MMMRFILCRIRTVHWPSISPAAAPKKKHSAMYSTIPNPQLYRCFSQLVLPSNLEPPQLNPLLGMQSSPAATPACRSHQKGMGASFYMRELPTSVGLIPYDSAEGKFIFKHALSEGGLEAFFPLSQQFLTQEEPACELSQTWNVRNHGVDRLLTFGWHKRVDCGIGTLCMILNAMKIDPAKTWRKPWRWFTQGACKMI